MADQYELLISAADAEALAPLLDGRTRGLASDGDAADALADLLHEARIVAPERLPDDVVALSSRVTYEDDKGAARTITVVHPAEADPGRARISVLSPIGRALLGRRAGATVAFDGPGGRALRIRIVAAEKPLTA